MEVSIDHSEKKRSFCGPFTKIERSLGEPAWRLCHFFDASSSVSSLWQCHLDPLSSVSLLINSIFETMAMRFRGSSWFRQRIVCATLSGRTIAIKDIRAKDEKPGLLGTLPYIQFQPVCASSALSAAENALFENIPKPTSILTFLALLFSL